jgi:hypothetical protein
MQHIRFGRRTTSVGSGVEAGVKIVTCRGSVYSGYKTLRLKIRFHENRKCEFENDLQFCL